MQTAVERLWRFPKPGHQRVLKLRGDAQQIFVNGEFSGGSSGFWDYTMYVNPYMVVRPEGHYTKHIYVNSERIASKIGNPEDFGAGDPTGQGDAVGRKIKMEEVVEENFNELFGNVPEIEQAVEQELGMSTGSTEPELNSYWFTSDHLGSSAFITDGSGVAIQHLEYMAFGEVFVDQRRTGFGTPYKFNGKELDCESGYYYYSARYYDPRMARFLGVDPMASDFPSWTPYHYVHNNPLRYTDPTGMRAEDIIVGDQVWTPGATYEGDDDFGDKVFAALNSLFETIEAGDVSTKEAKGNVIMDFVGEDAPDLIIAEAGTNKGSRTSESGSQIVWNPNDDIMVGDDGKNTPGVLSSETQLAHEMGHAWLAVFSPKLNERYENADAENRNPDINEHNNWILPKVENKFSRARGEGVRATYRDVLPEKTGFADYYLERNKR